MIHDFTTVIAVDEAHLEQLRLVWPNWAAKKPGLLYRPLIVIVDSENRDIIRDCSEIITAHAPYGIQCIMWPPPMLYPHNKKIAYEHDASSRFGDSQRYKMLASFVHVPANFVLTKYWLKLDLDTVAIGNEDWIDPQWFNEGAAIISHPWGYTKPPNQMMFLDTWADKHHLDDNFACGPLNLAPEPGSTILKHKRIISWCGFFETKFTRKCSAIAERICGMGKLPCPSQDGFMFYMAKRMGYQINRVNMKERGWAHCNNLNSIAKTIADVQ